MSRLPRWASATLLLSAVACSAGTQPADLAVFGKVWTGDSTRPLVGAVATRGDTIVAVGDSASIAKLIGERTRVMQNGSALVTPGFMDGHVHLLDGGFQLSSVDLRDADSPEEFVRRIAAFAAERRPGEWITGGDWDHERWPGAPLPRKEWIDSVTPNNPVFVSRLDGHMGLANGLALGAAGVTRTTREVVGGAMVRDRTTGDLTGILKDQAMNPVLDAAARPSVEQVDAALQRAMTSLNERGVTAVGALSSSGRSAVWTAWTEYAGVFRARQRGSLTLRVALFPPLSDWRSAAESLRVNGPGDEWVRLAGVKGYIDGSLGSTTALFFQPYEDDPSTSGLLVTPEDSLRHWIGAADSSGLQVAVHAIGEKANALVLDIYDSVASAHGPRDRRFRIEHVQHLRPQEIRRVADQRVVASMQPFHLSDDGRWAGKRLGARVSDSYVFRSLIDAGTRLAFGSDWPVAPADPILGIYAAVTRRTLDGKNPGGWIPEQKISVAEALRAYTRDNAYAVFAEGSRGMLKPGYRADLVLLDQDLLSIPPEAIETARVRATIAGGRVVYQATP
jgi:predicted amidohydrolase YtcJ